MILFFCKTIPVSIRIVAQPHVFICKLLLLNVKECHSRVGNSACFLSIKDLQSLLSGIKANICFLSVTCIKCWLLFAKSGRCKKTLRRRQNSCPQTIRSSAQKRHTHLMTRDGTVCTCWYIVIVVIPFY